MTPAWGGARGSCSGRSQLGHWYLTGDDEIERGMRIFAEAGGELGYM